MGQTFDRDGHYFCRKQYRDFPWLARGRDFECLASVDSTEAFISLMDTAFRRIGKWEKSWRTGISQVSSFSLWEVSADVGVQRSDERIFSIESLRSSRSFPNCNLNDQAKNGYTLTCTRRLIVKSTAWMDRRRNLSPTTRNALGRHAYEPAIGSTLSNPPICWYKDSMNICLCWKQRVKKIHIFTFFSGCSLNLRILGSIGP